MTLADIDAGAAVFVDANVFVYHLVGASSIESHDVSPWAARLRRYTFGRGVPDLQGARCSGAADHGANRGLDDLERAVELGP